MFGVLLISYEIDEMDLMYIEEIGSHQYMITASVKEGNVWYASDGIQVYSHSASQSIIYGYQIYASSRACKVHARLASVPSPSTSFTSLNVSSQRLPHIHKTPLILPLSFA